MRYAIALAAALAAMNGMQAYGQTEPISSAPATASAALPAPDGFRTLEDGDRRSVAAPSSNDLLTVSAPSTSASPGASSSSQASGSIAPTVPDSGSDATKAVDEARVAALAAASSHPGSSDDFSWATKLKIIIGCIVAVYFLPTLMAAVSRKRNTSAIAALNLFAGWTFIGWVVAMVWSMTSDPARTAPPPSPTVPPPPEAAG